MATRKKAPAVNPLPELAEKADTWHEMRLRRLAMQREVDAIELTEKQLQQQLMEQMQALGLSAIGGKLVALTVETVYEPTVEDWPAFYSRIQETGEFDMLYRRINTAAIKARWEQGALVPGVAKFPVQKLRAKGVK